MWPLYPPDARRDLQTARSTDANPAENPAIVAQLGDAAERFVALSMATFGNDLMLDFSDASIHRLGAAITRENRDTWLSQTGPDGVPVLAYVIIHGVAYVGQCVVKNHGGRWRIRQPLWESLVTLESRAGVGDLALLSWWVRALCDTEIGRATLTERYRSLVELPTTNPENLPVFFTSEHTLPRLKKPTYDNLHKYLQAHLPMMRDVGADFPSPARFAELDFRWLDFVLVGDGRMLLMHGPSAQGAMLIWLDSTGFVKSAYYPSDAFPDHVVKVSADKLQLITPWLGKNVLHEMLWWGP